MRTFSQFSRLNNLFSVCEITNFALFCQIYGCIFSVKRYNLNLYTLHKPLTIAY